MSAITIPDFKCSKQSSHGREERIAFIISEVKKDPSFHFEGVAYTKERCSDLASVDDTINQCLRMMYYAPQTRKDITEQILMELKII
jgi:hypothetical protein